MATKKANLLTAAAIVVLVILLIVLRLILGLSKSFYLILGADLAVILAIFVWVFLKYRLDGKRKSFERKMARQGRELRMDYSFLRKVAGVPIKFRYREIEIATDNFQALLGRGGSASVFKGILKDATPVAVKRISRLEHGEKEFRSEVAAIASVQHVNLIRLIGYSILHGGPRFLIYEFIQNGNLGQWIFPRRSGRFLPWDVRYRVAIEVAKGLAYLHHDCRSRILHLDIKPENILLDENFRAVVSDFGFSKLMGRDESRVYSGVRGTRGYLAPEWLLENGVSEKTDLYGYGMVLLEMVGGRRNVHEMGDEDDTGRKWSFFPKIVKEALREGKLVEVVDEKLRESGGVDEGQLKVLVLVALWCIQEDPTLRPSMTRVVEMLEGRAVVDNPPESTLILVDPSRINSHLQNGQHGTRSQRVATNQVDIQHPPSSTYTYSISDLSGR